MTHLPQGYSIRVPTMDDAQALADLVIACDIFESGSSDFTVGQVLDDWKHIDVASIGRLVIAPDGSIAGSEEVFHTVADGPYEIDGYVHPEHMGRGIGSFLVNDAEARIRQQMGVNAFAEPSTIRVNISDENQAAHQLFRDAGFTAVRYFWRMERQLNEAPPTPQLPAGITLRTLVEGQDEQRVYATVEEAFRDHWGHTSSSTPVDEWIATRLHTEGYAPELCFIACDGDEIAGVALCFERANNGGWVRYLGVRRPWRRTGLGMALLQTAFTTFYQRGRSWVGLGVDADSPTGATRLYTRAGMAATEQYAAYEKVVTLNR